MRVFAMPAILLAMGLLLSCGKEPAPATGDWPLDFHMPMDATFRMSGRPGPSGDGTLCFMRGDEPDQPRLVVSRRRLDLPPDQVLEEAVSLGDGVVMVEEGEMHTVNAINATGLGMRHIVQPFPAFDSTLTLAFDTRVFVVGPWTYSFAWQQVPEDTALATTYESWIQRLRFLPGALVDSAVVEEDATGDTPPVGGE